jgi:hypothetical protein
MRGRQFTCGFITRPSQQQQTSRSNRRAVRTHSLDEIRPCELRVTTQAKAFAVAASPAANRSAFGVRGATKVAPGSTARDTALMGPTDPTCTQVGGNRNNAPGRLLRGFGLFLRERWQKSSTKSATCKGAFWVRRPRVGI